MDSIYRTNLINRVIEKSISKNFSDAVLEWEIIDCEEDETNSSGCLCGKENIRYLFSIKNINTGAVLYPIGSTCIKKFNRNDLNEIISYNESLFKLLHAVEKDEFLSLSPELFSRKTLLRLYNDGAFSYNNCRFDPYSNYLFMLKMFNKIKKDDITLLQKKKIAAILLCNIKPYIKNRLSNKISH